MTEPEDTSDPRPVSAEDEPNPWAMRWIPIGWVPGPDPDLRTGDLA